VSGSWRFRLPASSAESLWRFLLRRPAMDHQWKAIGRWRGPPNPRSRDLAVSGADRNALERGMPSMRAKIQLRLYGDRPPAVMLLSFVDIRDATIKKKARAAMWMLAARMPAGFTRYTSLHFLLQNLLPRQRYVTMPKRPPQ